jgi:hypothetical protein
MISQSNFSRHVKQIEKCSHQLGAQKIFSSGSIWAPPKKGKSVKRIAAVILLFSVASCESNEERQARYEEARRECALVGAKTALPGYGNARENADKAIATMEECFRSRGFTVDVRKGTAK